MPQEKINYQEELEKRRRKKVTLINGKTPFQINTERLAGKPINWPKNSPRGAPPSDIKP